MDGNSKRTAPIWLLTYAGVVTIVLVVFAFLYSISTVDELKWRETSLELGGTELLFKGESPVTGVAEVTARSRFEGIAQVNKATDWQKLYYSLVEYMDSNAILSNLRVELGKDEIVIHVPDSLLFETGVTDIRPDGRLALAGLTAKAGESIALISRIRVEGHTDNRPLQNTSRYQDNLALSQSRSASVLRYMYSVEGPIKPEMYIAGGYGEFKPVATNETDEGRAQNRRVDIVLEAKSS